MQRQSLFVAAADGEEALAELLAGPLRAAGYEVRHTGTVAVGESVVEEATSALAHDLPVVLCGTVRAVGSAWTHQIVNASRVGGRPRVFVVQMDKHAYVDQLAVRTKVARYCDDPVRAVQDLLESLRKHFPPQIENRTSRSNEGGRVTTRRSPVDEPSGLTSFDFESLQSFRDALRGKAASELPPTLTPWEFLERAGLWVEDGLSLAGVLLFAKNPTVATPTSVVKCTQYFGLDRSAERSSVTFEGTVPAQIEAARQFVAERARRGEAPGPDSAQAVNTYDYPMVAVREIVANALVHRDYSVAEACVHVRLFSDRLEVASPGIWLERELTPGHQYDLVDLEGQSVKRNFRLAHVLSWTSFVEGEGSGIPSTLRDCRRYGSPPPTVVQEQGFVKITLPRRPESRTGQEVAWPHQVGALPVLADSYQPRAAGTLLDDATAGQTQVLRGLGGAGKTQLAAAYAQRLWRGQEVDLLAWINAGSRTSVTSGYAEAASGIIGGDLAGSPDQAAQRFLAWLASTKRRWLIVLDDLTDPSDLTGLWPPVSDSGRTLVTTRRRDAALQGPGRQYIDVDLFTPTEARHYLEDKLAVQPASLDGAEALAEDLGYLPLALAQAAAYISDQGLTCERYRRRLGSRRLAEVTPEALPDDYGATMAATWELSIELADQQSPHRIAGPVLEIAAFLDPNGIPAALFELTPIIAVCGRRVGRDVDDEDVHDALRALHRLSLVTVDARTVRTHALVQRVVREATTFDQAQQLASAAADALLEAWPDVERDTTYVQLLRANTLALESRAGRQLWNESNGAHPVLFRVGNSLGESGQVVAAATHFRHLCQLSESYLGSDHPSTLIARANLASWQGKAGDLAGAVGAYENLLTDMLRLRGPDHPDVLAARHNLASWRGIAGDAAGAVSAYQDLLTDTLRLLGPDHPDVLAARHNLAFWRAEADDPAAAVNGYQNLLTDMLRVLGPDHPDTLTTRANLARWRGEAGDPAAAVDGYENLLTDMLRVLGPDHPDTLATRANLTRWRKHLGSRQTMNISGAQGLQIGDGNIQHNVWGPDRRNA